MKRYFIHIGGEQKGPYSIEELRNLNITGETNVWSEGMADWKNAKDVEDLSGLFKTTPPPFQNQVQSPPQIKSSKPQKNNSWVIIAIFLGVTAIGGAIYSITLQSTEASITKVLDEKEQEKLTEEENKRIEEEKRIEAAKREIRRNLNNYITIRPNNYSVGLLGGIRNLSFNVTNNTGYLIENVELEVTYIKSNGGVYTIKKVKIENIPANGIGTQKVSDEGRGTSIEFDIKEIYSSKLDLCYIKNRENGNSDDPYKCSN